MSTALAPGSDIEKGKKAEHRSGRVFLVLMTALIVAAVAVGFGPTYFLQGAVRAKLPGLIVHVHGLLNTGWIVLLAAQVAFAASGYIQWHRRIGSLGIWLAPAMTVVAIATQVEFIRRHAFPVPLLKVITATESPLLLIFGFFVVWAYLARNNPATHKRAMLLATFAIIVPAIARMHIAQSTVRFMTLVDVFPTLLVVYDLWTIGKIHRATVYGVFVTGIWQVTFLPFSRSAVLDRVVAFIQNG